MKGLMKQGRKIKLLLHLLNQSQVPMSVSCVSQCCPLEERSRTAATVRGFTGTLSSTG